MRITEENYVRLMQRGNEKALWYFIEHYGWIIKSIVHSKMAAYPEDQEECINDIFLAIWENVGKYDGKRAAFTTWVAGVARYRMMNFMRSRRPDRGQLNIDDLDLAGESDVTSDIYCYDDEKEFREMLECLSEQDQEIFMKLFWDEMSLAEISEHTGMKREVLYNRISRGKKKLRRRIEEDKYDGYL